MLRAPDQAALLQAHLMQHDSAPLLAAHAMGVAHAWSLEALTWGDARALVRRTNKKPGRAAATTVARLLPLLRSSAPSTPRAAAGRAWLRRGAR
jgi:hypothetical protein